MMIDIILAVGIDILLAVGLIAFAMVFSMAAARAHYDRRWLAILLGLILSLLTLIIHIVRVESCLPSGGSDFWHGCGK